MATTTMLSMFTDSSNGSGPVAAAATNETDVAYLASGPICPSWLPTNHLLFQLSNIFLFLSYMAPGGIHGLLYLRICLTLGSFFFALWGYVILCAFDTLVWNAFFTLLNLVHVCVLMYILRPVRFSAQMETLYRDMFQPLKVSRQQFQSVAGCVKETLDLKPRENYSLEGVSRADRLTLVLAGRLLASQNGRGLQIVDKHEFLDSPEWFGVCSTDYYQVTTTALEKCRVVVWNRDKLKLTISGDAFLKAVFDNVVGKDVVKKLLFVMESSSNGVVHDPDSVSESTKLLIQMKNEKSGMGVLLNRQCRDCTGVSVWNLSQYAGSMPALDPETTV